MSIAWHEQEPVKQESPKSLDIKVEKSESGEGWKLSFVAESAEQRSAYRQAFDITMKMNSYHAEEIQNGNEMESSWEISDIPEGTEEKDFDTLIRDIQDRANSFLEQKLAA